MFRKLFAVLISVCILLGGISAMAEDFSASAVYTPESGEIRIGGVAPAGYIVVAVAPYKLAEENFSDSLLPSVIKQYKVSGEFSLKLQMPDNAEGGKYNIYISAGDEEIIKSFVHIDGDSALEIVESLKKADGAGFKTIASENAEKLGIDAEDEGYKAKSEKILTILDKLQYEDVYEFYSQYVVAYALVLMQGEEDSEKTKELLRTYSEKLGISYEEDFENDEKLTESAKEELLKLISATDYSKKIKDGYIDFESIYNSLKPVASIKTADNWTELREAITENFADDFSEMLSKSTKYKKIKDKDAVFEEMIKTDFTSMEEVEEVFEKAVAKVYKSENKGADTSGGSTGGSSGSSYGGVSSGGVAISPTYNEEKSESVAKLNLSDVSETHWAFDAISTLFESGVISGYEDNTFRPSNPITRAEFVKLILPYASSVKSEGEVSFGDVSESAWYASIVKEAASKGIIKGEGDKFSPDNYIKREDAALIIYRLLDLLGKAPDGYRIFADREDVSSYAKDAVFALAGDYILKGNDDNMFLPKSPITRAETAQLIYNAFKK